MSRFTNLALAVLLVAAVATGLVGQAIGTGWGVIPIVAHGATGLAIVLLTPWKTMVMRRGLRRGRRGRLSSIGLGVTVAATVALMSI